MTDIDEVPEYADGAFALAYGLGYDARLDELNKSYAEIAALKNDLERTRDERNRARLEEQRKWKAAQPDLQPLHELVTKWADVSVTYDDYYLESLEAAIAKIQSAGAVKP